MNDTFVRTQPTKLRMLSKLLRDHPEIRHQFVNFPADQLLAQPFNRLTNQLIPQTKRKHDAGAEDLVARSEQSGGKCVLGARVHSIATRSLFKREAQVACFQ